MPSPAPSHDHPVTREVVELFQQHGHSRYGGEAVTQLEHALQAAHFAEEQGASAPLIVAALLHDIGHLLHNLPEDAPEHGIDDCHEDLGSRWLQRHFRSNVTEPVQLHVAAKRYLCAVEPSYIQILSNPSIESLHLQGGAMSQDEVKDFEKHPYFRDAVALRRWDDQAKIVGLATAGLDHFAKFINQVQVASHV